MKPPQAAAALLELIAENRSARCRAELERAQAEVRAILGEAHREARKRVRSTLEEARGNAAGRVALAEAQVRTRERAARQRQLKARLDQTWPLVGALLRAAWDDPQQRSRWTEHYARCALEVLPAGDWQILHPNAWPQVEQARLAEILAGRALRFTPDPSIAAGLRFVSGNSMLDATERGLLADRAGIEGRLLFHAQVAE